ncbi:MAG: type II toxin-antitoxin system HipA family toxin [Planctomycetes bacterium]|nr:type II toxin-antitoxin system HipA family toxin [Planctomycetota bacterium]
MATRRAERYVAVGRVEVWLWDHFVGACALDPGLGFYVFAFDRDFAKAGIEPAPLQMPVAADERTFVFPTLPVDTYRRLPAMLADALPDDFGNALIDRWLADRGVPRESVTPLDRLAYVGRRSMGALEFRPQRGPMSRKPTAIELGELVVAARQALLGTWSDNDDVDASTLRSIMEVGTSAGGARAKAVIAWNPTTHEIRSGQLDAPEGFEHWLLKFDGVGTDRELGSTRDYGRIEFAYHRMARAAGITMTDCRLLEENGRAHFMTKRFDRDGASTRHHVQTLCAMAHLDFRRRGANSYAQAFLTMRQLDLPREDLVEAFRRMAFAVMARNCDDHTKNVAFVLRQGRPWRLAPAYDVTFAHNPRGEWTNQHLMSVNGRFRDIGADDLLAEADRFAIGEGKAILAEVRTALARWHEFAAAAGVATAEIERIATLHRPV